MALHMARMAKRLTSNVTIYTDGAEELAQQIVLAAVDDDVKVDSRPIALLKNGAEKSSVVVHLGDGQQINEGFLVSHLQFLRIILERNGDQPKMRNADSTNRYTSRKAKSTGRSRTS